MELKKKFEPGWFLSFYFKTYPRVSIFLRIVATSIQHAIGQNAAQQHVLMDTRDPVGGSFAKAMLSCCNAITELISP